MYGPQLQWNVWTQHEWGQVFGSFQDGRGAKWMYNELVMVTGVLVDFLKMCGGDVICQRLWALNGQTASMSKMPITGEACRILPPPPTHTPRVGYREKGESQTQMVPFMASSPICYRGVCMFVCIHLIIYSNHVTNYSQRMVLCYRCKVLPGKAGLQLGGEIF